jgi:hypothetical protein
MGISDLLVSYN